MPLHITHTSLTHTRALTRVRVRERVRVRVQMANLKIVLPVQSICNPVEDRCLLCFIWWPNGDVTHD